MKIAADMFLSHPAVKVFASQWDRLSDADKTDEMNRFPAALQLLAAPILAALPADLLYEEFDQELTDGLSYEALQELIEAHPDQSDLPHLSGEQLDGMRFTIATVKSSAGRLGVRINTHDGYIMDYNTLILAVDRR